MRLRSMALAGAALISLCGPAAAGQGVYIGAEVGKSAPVDVQWKFPDLPGTSGRINQDSSWLFGGVIGYKIPDGLRFEFEASHVSYDLDSFSVGNTLLTADGDISETALFGNLIYDLQLTDRWAVSLGGGIGGAWSQPDATVGSGAVAISKSEGSFAWQLTAGLVYSITPQIDISADYKFRSIDTTDHDWDSITTIRLGNKNSHSVLLAIRYFFQPSVQPTTPEPVRALPPPPAPPPPPPPLPLAPPAAVPPPAPPQAPPPPPPAVSTFIVFFDFDRSDLTPQAQQIVAQAVAAARNTGNVRVVVTGHTDTVGSQTYNQALSERRAQSVENEMVRLGLNGNDITTAGRSFSDPLVQTGPGVREPQNRRAVIQLGR